MYSALLNLNPTVEITEQPNPSLRFRYKSDKETRETPIKGATSTHENITFPTIQIKGYFGLVQVLVSCVTTEEPYRSHPHSLIGKKCNKGIFAENYNITPENNKITFSRLGVERTKNKINDFKKALKIRKEIKVDPFKTGFEHRNHMESIDFHTFRLCFQVFIQDNQQQKSRIALTPIVSEPIYDKPARSSLSIVKLSDCVSPVDGGIKDIILVSKNNVEKKDIKVRFFEEYLNGEVWVDFGINVNVYHGYVIWFKAPRYHTVDINNPAKVNIQLYRPSDGATSNPLPFELIPLVSEPCYKRKMKCVENILKDLINIPPIFPQQTNLYPTNVYLNQVPQSDCWSMPSTSTQNIPSPFTTNTISTPDSQMPNILLPTRTEPTNQLNQPNELCTLTQRMPIIELKSGELDNMYWSQNLSDCLKDLSL